MMKKDDQGGGSALSTAEARHGSTPPQGTRQVRRARPLLSLSLLSSHALTWRRREADPTLEPAGRSARLL
jgi:hypothetical protein